MSCLGDRPQPLQVSALSQLKVLVCDLLTVNKARGWVPSFDWSCADSQLVDRGKNEPHEQEHLPQVARTRNTGVRIALQTRLYVKCDVFERGRQLMRECD